jgi:lactam utilization protein B
MLSIALHGYVIAIDGSRVSMSADSFCLHSDTPNSEAIAQAIVDAVRENNLAVRAPSTSLSTMRAEGR